MREIGGYIELDKYTLPMLHEDAIALNCGRNALAYVIRSRKIKKIRIPKFLCDSVRKVCIKENVSVQYYSIDIDFLPQDIVLDDGEWLYIVNYYGQLDEARIKALKDKYERIIIDNAQAYFQMPVEGIDTLYTCRKFFGVPDGAFLYTDTRIKENLVQDESFERMRFLLGRFERTASEFYNEYSENNHLFAEEPIKQMSKLTENLLHGIDYKAVKQRRTDNFKILHDSFCELNHLQLIVPEGAFMYPLYVSKGAEVRKQLQAERIYIPTLWPDVFECCCESELEFDMARNILPIPCDQRYDSNVMKEIVQQVNKLLKVCGG